MNNLSKSEENIQKFDILLAYSDVYNSMHLIDVTKDTIFEYNATENIRAIFNDLTDAAAQMEKFVELTVANDYQNIMYIFTDLHTIRDRMRRRKILNIEYVSKDSGWMRATFLTTNSAEDGTPVKILFTTLDINEEKKYKEELLQQSITDGMTRLKNRRAYEIEFEKLEVNGIPQDFVYIALDVNGLKFANDNLGHAAGDELLCAAADHIKSAFSDYGNVYRTGGDEFVAMIRVSREKIGDIVANFESDMSNWKGVLITELSISIGYAFHSDFPNLSLESLSKIADDRMYAYKAAYYARTGKDRRIAQGDEAKNFRPLRRTKNAITIESAKELLQNEKRGVLSVNGDNGYPFAMPINFIYDETTNKIYFHGATSGHKVDSIKKNSKVCFTVYGKEEKSDSDWAPYLSSAVVYGKCKLIADPEITKQHLKELGMKYYPSEQEVDEEIARDIKSVQLFEISIEHISGKKIHEK